MKHRPRLYKFLSHFLIAAVFMSSLGGAFFGLYDSAMAATYYFTQTSWSGGTSTTAFPTHASNTQNSYSSTWWTKYYSKDALTTAGTVITLASSSNSITQTDDGSTNTGFNMASSTNSSTAVSGSGNDASVQLSLSDTLFTNLNTSTVGVPGNANAVAFSPDGKYFAVAHNGTPYLTVYSFDPDNYLVGNAITPTSTCGATGVAVEFHPSGNWLAMSCANSSVTLYPFTSKAFNATSGVLGVPVTSATTGAVNGFSFSPTGRYIAIAHSGSPYVTVYTFNTSTAAFTNPKIPASTPASTGRDVTWHPTEEFVAVAHSASPFGTVYVFNSSTPAFGSKVTLSALPNGTSLAYSVRFHPNGKYLAFAYRVTAGGGLAVYNFKPGSSTSAVGNQLSDPSTVPGTISQVVRFSPDGGFLTVGFTGTASPFHYVYDFSVSDNANATSGIIGSVLSPNFELSDDGNGASFHPSSTFLVYGHQLVSPYVALYERIPRYPTTEGTYISGPIDFGSKQNFTTFSYASSGLAGTSIVIDIRAGSDTAPPTWGSVTSNWPAYISNISSTSVNISSLSGYRYIQYRTRLSNSGNNTITPSLQSITFNSYSYPTSSTILGSPFDGGDDSSILSGFSWKDTASSASGTDVRFQLRSGDSTSTLLSSSFIGPDSTSNSFFSSSTCTKISGAVSCTLGSTSTLKTGSNDRWFQYKAFISSEGNNAPTITSATSTYVVNAPPSISGVTVATTTSTSSPTSTIRIQFDVSDSDTVTNYVSSSFEYSTSSGVSWIPITSASLNSTSSDTTAVSAASSTKTAIWSPSVQIPEVYATSVQIRVTSNDFEPANNIGRATGTLTVLDTKTPTGVSLSFDSRVGTDTLTIAGSDDSSLEYLLSNSSDFSTDGLNSSSGVWLSAGSNSLSTTTTWNATGTPSYETVYLKVRDVYGNTTTTSVVAPHTPQSLTVSDISNVSAGFYAEYLSWATSTATTGASTAFYEIYRSANNTSSFAFIASTTNTFYQDVGLNTSNTYYYKIAVKSTQGNYSNYSDIVGDQPNGRAANIAPQFDTTLDSANESGVLISQVTSTASSDWGKIKIQYSVRDTDTDFSPVAGVITPSFAYNTGSGWVSISSGYLNSTSTDAKSVSSSSYTTYTAIWSASTSLPSTYTTNLQVRVIANDGDTSNNTTAGISAPITLDTTAPTLSSSLLVNNSTSNAPATSTSVTLKIQNITGTPSGETIYPQFSNDGSTWYGMSGSATTTGLGTAVSSTAAALSALSWPWTISGTNTVYLRVVDAYNNYSATTSVSVQGINQAPLVQNLSAIQSTSSLGLVTINYQVYDADQSAVSSTFEYSTNGSSWTSISGMNSTSTSLSGLSTSTYNSITSTWNASSQLNGVYYGSLQIRLTLNDAQSVNSSTVATTSFVLDTLGPTKSITVDARSTTGTLTLSASDDTNLEYLLSNSSTFAADGVNASSGIWISVGDTSLSTTTAWTLDSTSAYATVYFEVRDAYGNTTSTSAVAPATISGLTIQDISERASNIYKHLLTWNEYTATTSASLSYYEIYRSSNGTSSFSRIGTSTAASYTDLNLSSTTTYYYEVVVVSTNGNYSNYSEAISSQPTGAANTAPNFNTSFDATNQTGATILQVGTSTDANWGNVIIQYSVRDADTLIGSSTPGYITPSFEYNTGAGWVAIATSTLNSTSTDNKAVSSSSYTTYTAVWSASSTLSTYTTNLRVRVRANDNESSNNIGEAITAPITLDTTAPTLASTTLLINGASNNAEATSTSVTLQLQSITGTPSGESVYIQFSNDGSTWYAANADGSVTSTANTLGTLVSSTAATLSDITWPWTFSGSSVYVRVFDAFNNGPVSDSNTVFGYNTAPEIQNLSASQIATTTDENWGAIKIDFEVRDTDTSSGLVSSTFAYSTSSGASWTAIPTSTLNATATASFAVSSSSYTAYSVTWNVSSTLANTYSTGLKVRVTVDDKASVNNQVSSTATLTVDTQAPSIVSNSLLINDSASSGQSTSSQIALKLQNITGSPLGETVYVQFSDDNSTWYGANASGTLASSSEWGSGFSSASATLSTLSWTWDLGSGTSSRSQIIYARVIDAYNNLGGTDSNGVGYNASPEFNPSFGTNGVSISQVSSSIDSTWGKVLIQYSIRDADTTVGSSTPGYITPSFEYNIGGGWASISSSSLGATDLENKAVDASSYTTYTATWNASSQIASTYTTALQVRVIIDDNESVSNTTSATSSQITLDTKAPSTTIKIDSRTDQLSLNLSDDSNIELKLSNDSGLIADGLNASSGEWVALNATSTNSSTSWTLAASSSLETVYYAVRDAFGNTLTGSVRVPTAPASTTISDISDASALNFKELVSWEAYTATSGPTFARYEVYRATNSDPSNYSLLASISNSEQNYYTDLSLTSSTTYYYKVTIVTTNGDYSGYGDIVSDQPDGLSGAAAGGPTISDVTAAEVQASWARITWTTDRVANSKVEYSLATSSSLYSLSTTSITLVTSHDVTINDLLPNSSYVFRVVSTDVNGKQSTEDGGSFITTGGPIISAVTTEAVTDHTATILWNTNKDANSTVVYSTNLSNLRDDIDTSEAGSVSLVGSPFQHRVTVSGLDTQTTYYYYVKSTDVLGNISSDKNNGNFYTFTTAQDIKAPVISNVTVAAVTQTAAVITWQTDEPSNTQISYDSISSNTHRNFTTLDDTMTVAHSAVISGLTKNSTYYFRVFSIDPAGNAASSSEETLETSDSDAPIIYAFGGGAPPIPTQDKDTTAPGISNIEVSDITPFSAKITFKTNEEAVGFISFGETEEYGRTVSDPRFLTDHSIQIPGLKLGTTYNFEVKATDKAGNFGTAVNATFTTKFAVENVGDIATLDNVEQYQNQIDKLIESIAPSLVTPFVGKIEVTDITEDSVVVKWTTNTNTYGSVSYVADKDYDETKTNPYLAEVSDTQDKTTTHQVTLNNLVPGQLYRFQIKAYTLPNVVGRSQERTFVTKSSKLVPQISQLLNTSFVVTWQTTKKTSSFIEYQNTRTNQIRRTGSDELSVGHVVSVEDLDPNTTYRVRAFGYDENNNIVESEAITVTTRRDITPPVISGLRIDNTFVPGRNDRIQTVISWRTDEPASSLVLYSEGSTPSRSGLSNVASSTDDTLSTSHNVIITNFKPGTIYQMQVVSVDSAGNRGSSPTRVIITPKQTQSVFDVIVKNFEGTFKFLNQ